MVDKQSSSGFQSHPESQRADVPAVLRTFSLSQKGKALEELVCDGWLSNMDDRIGLVIRSFLDLRSWFHQNEISPCVVCNEAVLKMFAQVKVVHSEFTNMSHQEVSQRNAGEVCLYCDKPWLYTITKAW